MTVEEKRKIVKNHCFNRTGICSTCPVGILAKARGEVRESGAAKCWSEQDVTESMLDARIVAIQAEQGSVGTPVEEFVTREDKIAALNEHCDGTTCSDCPCHIDDLKKYCVDGYTCDFKEMSDEGLDAYLKVIEAAKLKKMSSHDFAVAIAERAAQRELNAEKDNVNHPKHYELPNGLECIDVLLATQGKDFVMGFCLCNAMKYLYRHKRKNGVEDIKKARWYIDKYLELEAEGHGK